MASPRARRDKWRHLKGGWALSLGHRGSRIRLFENRCGVFYVEVRQPGGARLRYSLNTRSKEHAEQLGKAILSDLLAGKTPPRNSTLRLGDLTARFLKDCPMLADNAKGAHAQATTQSKILCAVIGAHRDVRTLTPDDVTTYAARRKAGGITYGNGEVTTPVRQRTVQGDLKLLKQMLRWACTVTAADGTPLLDRNPLVYVKIQAPRDVRRAVATDDRYEKTQAAIRELQSKYEGEMAQASTPKQRDRAERRLKTWIRAELGLYLLDACGKRRGAIMALRWECFDTAMRCVTWPADKGVKSWVVYYDEAFFERVREFQRRLGAISGWVFPKVTDPGSPAPPELLSQWIATAETNAGLPKLDGGLLHPYRRKWRTQRLHHPMKAVMHAGGWNDAATMVRCYDHPDAEDILAVTSEPKKRRERLTA